MRLYSDATYHRVFHVPDAILIPTPFYGVITEDLDLYSEVKLFHVPLDCEVGMQRLVSLRCFLCVKMMFQLLTLQIVYAQKNSHFLHIAFTSTY